MGHRQRRMLTLHLVGILFCVTTPTMAQVFDASPTASVGEVDEGTGQAFYGTFGLDAASAAPQSYRVFRKLRGLDSLDTGPEIHTLTPLPDNDTAAIWEGLDHGGSGTQSGFHDPGMYIGNSPSSSSYTDQLVYFGPNRNGTGPDDFDGGVGGGNLPNGTEEPDSNDRVNWEVSVGFLEDPDGFINGRDPQTNQWDLWSGDWGTDGIQTRLFFTATDSSEIGNTEWFSFNESTGGAIGTRAQSGDPDSAISGESNRDAIPTTRRHVGSGTEIDEFDGDFPAGGTDGMAVHNGVNYDDVMELSWNMELNDPENPDAVKNREVRFSVKTGNLEYSAVFDPGDATNPVEPNETNDPGTTYTDGFFDWQSATPVFYLGLDNGTDYGEDGAWGIMGVFEPGDFNADGTVDATDRSILEANLNQIDTVYSRGDIDQDGDTDADDLAAWDALGGTLAGDFNNNGLLDLADVNMLNTQIDAATNDVTFDLNADILVNDSDLTVWVKDLRKTWFGDANLDGEFTSDDIIAVLAAGKFQSDAEASWLEGDWDADLRFTTSDIVKALADGGFDAGPLPAATAAVPEPTGISLCLMALLSILCLTRRKA